MLDSGLRNIVHVESSEGVFEPRTVELSGIFGDRAIVAGGLREGERVVVSGNFLLDSESRMGAWGDGERRSGMIDRLILKRIAAPIVGGIFTSFVLELPVYPAIDAMWRSPHAGQESFSDRTLLADHAQRALGHLDRLELYTERNESGVSPP